MATAILVPILQSQVSSPSEMLGQMTIVGTADAGDAIRAADGSKYLEVTDTTPTDNNGDILTIFKDDGVTLPLSAVINSVTVRIRVKGANFYIQDWALTNQQTFDTANIDFAGLPLGIPHTVGSFTTYDSTVYAHCPLTSALWTRNDIFNFNQNTLSTAQRLWTIGALVIFSTPGSSFQVDYFALVVDYVATPSLWFFNGATNEYRYETTSPGPDWVESSPTLSVISVSPTSGT